MRFITITGPTWHPKADKEITPDRQYISDLCKCIEDAGLCRIAHILSTEPAEKNMQLRIHLYNRLTPDMKVNILMEAGLQAGEAAAIASKSIDEFYAELSRRNSLINESSRLSPPQSDDQGND